jgi:hypothetical protein
MKTKVIVALGFIIPLCVGQPSLAASGDGAAVAAERRPTYVAPYNAVVIVLDTSISFQIPSRAPGLEGKVLSAEALKLVQRYVQEGAEQRRRRSDGQDIYHIVAADAASQEIWSGTREQLSELTPDTVARKLVVRRQFANCTDIEAALNEAGRLLRRHPDATEKFLLVFSDMLAEPPRKTWTDCAPPSGDPPAGIDWDAFRDARIGLYFVSKKFEYRPDLKWRREMERRGLRAEVLDEAQSLTDRLVLSPPPAATYRPTRTQVQAAARNLDTVKNLAAQAAMWGGGLIGLAVMCLLAYAQYARRRRR